MSIRRLVIVILISVVAVATAVLVHRQFAARHGATAGVTIDYPEDGSVFPPDMIAPLFSWHDGNHASTGWRIDVAFAGGTEGIHVESAGPPPQIGEIDPRCVSDTNERPTLTPDEARSHTWRPDEKVWETIKRRTVDHPATVTITSLANTNHSNQISIQVSKDPVGAPIFYRDVPLMPAENDLRVISPLAKAALPLINWRLRNVAEPQSRLLLQDMPTCANCHSFSGDGKTLGMDLDGPLNDKSMYAIAPVVPEMSIRDRDVIRWDAFVRGEVEKWKGSGFRLGFMSQVSPDANYIVTTLKSQIYSANFKNYRFLQVFFPTRGILGWYSKSTGLIQALPGADDPQYVHAGATWSPDGKYLVFSRAEAKDAYPEGRPMATHANDPNEIPMQYDLYRVPFNDGKGGRAEPVAGAAKNGMSNSFPKVSPDGRWIVFVQCRNGFLMRPDSQLYIVPAAGGTARRMRCNTKLMNSWHSFSPNGRWLVFSSKSRGAYTKMFLTHLDNEGNDSPAILIENSTAANRAVNIPEFVNIASNGLMNIDVPATKAYRLFNLAEDARKTGVADKAVAEFRKALEIDPQFSIAHNNLGVVLAGQGKIDEAIAHFRKAVDSNPNYAEAYKNLGVILAGQSKMDEAIVQFQHALRISPGYAEAHFVLGNILVQQGKLDEAIAHYEQALHSDPDYAEAHNNLGLVLANRGRAGEAAIHFRKAEEITTGPPSR